MLRILVAEDEPRQRVGIVRLLCELEPCARVAEAADGLEALALCERERFDVIITDIRMPGLNGIELLTELHMRNYGAYTVIVSAFEEFEHARKAIRLNVRDYLTKPFTKSTMRALLENAKSAMSNQTDRPLPWTADDARPVDELLDYLANHYHEEFTLEELAGRFHFHPNYLSILIKQRTGLTFTQHISRLRVDRAKELLKKSDESIHAIAGQVGFRDASYFNRVFKSLVGISPSRYRRIGYAVGPGVRS